MDNKTDQKETGSMREELVEGVCKDSQESKNASETMATPSPAVDAGATNINSGSTGITHNLYCNIRLWNETHRNTLLTSEEMSNFMVDFIVKTKGRNKTADRVDEIKESIEKQVSSPGGHVQEYLKEFNKVYDAFEEVALSKCKCLQSGAQTTSQVGTTEMPAPSGGPVLRPIDFNVVIEGPNLSESESEEEPEEMIVRSVNEEVFSPSTPATLVIDDQGVTTDSENTMMDVSVHVHNEQDKDKRVTSEVSEDMDIDMTATSDEDRDGNALLSESADGQQNHDQRTGSPVVNWIDKKLEEWGKLNVTESSDLQSTTVDEMENTNKENVGVNVESQLGANNVQQAETFKNTGDDDVIKGLGLEVSDDEEELDYEYDENEGQ